MPAPVYTSAPNLVNRQLNADEVNRRIEQMELRVTKMTGRKTKIDTEIAACTARCDALKAARTAAGIPPPP